jgi:BirA family biotin operon repressor/biotin-[acetyl-CoA-carboxylase] ligase
MIIGRQLFYYPSLSSTNNYAKKLLNNNVVEGTIIVAEKQLEGRGRKSREWCSPKNGLWFSVILYPNISPQKAMYITMVASISIVKAIKEICNINTKIKWPNDILCNGKKICGILTELDAEIDKINYVIIGIGINVNNRIPTTLSESATSLKNEIGIKISRVNLICSILTHFDEIYKKILKKDFDSIKKSWLNNAKIVGMKISVHGENKTIKGIVAGIDDNGCLLLKSKKGTQQVVSGDIKYL